MVCFKDPSRYDLLSEGGKQAGAAQRRTNLGLLHQGSIRLGSIPHERLAAALPHGFARAFACRFQPFVVNQAFLDSAESLACERYRSEAWRQQECLPFGPLLFRRLGLLVLRLRLGLLFPSSFGRLDREESSL